MMSFGQVIVVAPEAVVLTEKAVAESLREQTGAGLYRLFT